MIIATRSRNRLPWRWLLRRATTHRLRLRVYIPVLRGEELWGARGLAPTRCTRQLTLLINSLQRISADDRSCSHISLACVLEWTAVSSRAARRSLSLPSRVREIETDWRRRVITTRRGFRGGIMRPAWKCQLVVSDVYAARSCTDKYYVYENTLS